MNIRNIATLAKNVDVNQYVNMVVIAIFILMVVMAEAFNNCVFHTAVHARINTVAFYTIFDEHICQNITVCNVQGENNCFAVFLFIIKIFLNNNFVTFVNLCNLVDCLFRQITFRQNVFSAHLYQCKFQFQHSFHVLSLSA